MQIQIHMPLQIHVHIHRHMYLYAHIHVCTEYLFALLIFYFHFFAFFYNFLVCPSSLQRISGDLCQPTLFLSFASSAPLSAGWTGGRAAPPPRGCWRRCCGASAVRWTPSCSPPGSAHTTDSRWFHGWRTVVRHKCTAQHNTMPKNSTQHNITQHATQHTHSTTQHTRACTHTSTHEATKPEFRYILTLTPPKPSPYP